MPRIVFVGGTYESLYMNVGLPPKPGEVVLDGRYFRLLEGAANLQALAAIELGADVTILSAVGSDEAGDQAFANWFEAGIREQFSVQMGLPPTGRKMVIRGEESWPATAIAAGANNFLSMEHIDAAGDFIDAADLLVATLEIPPNITAYAFKRAKQSGVATLLHVDPVRTEIRAALHLADVVALDEAAAEQLGAQLVGKQTITRMRNYHVQWRAGQQSGTMPVPGIIDPQPFHAALAYALAEEQVIPDAIAFALKKGRAPF